MARTVNNDSRFRVLNKDIIFLIKHAICLLYTLINKSYCFADPSVREASAEALGTLMKLVGEKAIGPFLVELEKDNLKMLKIREFCEKAVITVKVAGVKSERPTTAPAKIGEPKNVAANKKVAGN